jgi:hypothetical protein
MQIEIRGSEATLLSVGKSKWPAKAEGGLRFTDISYLGEGKWKAVNRSWRFSDKVEEGRWHDYGPTTLALSADKNSFTGGNTSFTRKVKLTDAANNTEPGEKTTLEVNYEGVMVKYTVAKTSGGNTYVLMQATNTHEKVQASLVLSPKTGSAVIISIDPGATYTTKLNLADYEVGVSFKPYKNASGPDITGLIKKVVKYLVTVEGGNVKSKLSYSGVRG